MPVRRKGRTTDKPQRRDHRLRGRQTIHRLCAHAATRAVIRIRKERYKASPADVTECIDKLDIRLTTRKYLNFVRIDKAESLDMIEGLLFIVTPDILSGLAAWAFFDNNSDCAVSCLFGSGCSSVVAQAVRENRLGGRRTFIGMLDPSARPYIGADELSFVIPAVRLPEMLDTIDRCCLSGTHGWTKIKERINGRME